MGDILLTKIVPEGPHNPDTSRDAWATPPDHYKHQCRKWGVHPTIDVAAEAHNTKCEVFITKDMDALSIDWMAFAYEKGVEPIFWMNPPYSNDRKLRLCYRFCKKAYETAKAGGTILGLLPATPFSPWYQEFIKTLKEEGRGDHDFPEGRIAFLPPPGIKASTPRGGNLEVIWHPLKGG